MNFTPTIPFDRYNSYICKYIDSCVFLNHKKETKWLLKTNGIAYDSNITNNERELNQLIEIIVKNLNATGPNSSDFIDLTHESQTRFLNKFEESIQEYLKSKKEKPKEKNFSIESMEDLLPIALGKIFTPKTMIKYLNLISSQNPLIIPINFTINSSFIGVLIPVFTLNLTSDSLITDVSEPIEKFVTSKNPETKLIIPVLHTYKRQKNQWNLLVIRKQKLLNSKLENLIENFTYGFYGITYNRSKIFQITEKLYNFFENILIPKIDNKLQINATNKLNFIDDFIKKLVYSPISNNFNYQNLESISKDDTFESNCYSSVAAIQYIRHITYNINMDFTGENIPFYRERIIRELFHDRIIEPPRDNLVRENKKRSLSPTHELFESTNNIDESPLLRDQNLYVPSDQIHQDASSSISLSRSKINNLKVTLPSSNTDSNNIESNREKTKASDKLLKELDEEFKYIPPKVEDLMEELISNYLNSPPPTTSILLTPTIHNLHVDSPRSSNKKQKKDNNKNKSKQQTTKITSSTLSNESSKPYKRQK